MKLILKKRQFVLINTNAINTKKNVFLLVVFCCLTAHIKAQWSNTTNFFSDSNHMPVSTVTGDQVNSYCIRSYPDGGYIFFWEDNRNATSTKTDIYAQKFDKNGRRLWTSNGIPVSNGANRQHFFEASSIDARNYSYAATDSANGFYITYMDDSISGSATLPRIMVQHVKSSGSRVFGTAGHVVARSTGTDYKYDFPQLIADSNAGFFLGYRRAISSFNGTSMDVFVNCFRDENGLLKSYGGNQMDANAYLQPICGANSIIAYRDAYVNDYQIYPNRQKGCNIVMSLTENGAGTENNYTGFNALIRVKKNTTTKRFNSNTGNTSSFTFKKDSVIKFYDVLYTTYTYTCGNATGTGYVLHSNGFLKVGNYALNVAVAQGTTLATSGNINAEVITSNIRRYINNTLTNWYTQRFVTRSEIYADMPYEFKNPPYYVPATLYDNFKPGLNTISGGTDTLLSNNSISAYNYCMKGSGNKIYTTALCSRGGYNRYDVLLQQLQLNRKSPTSFAVEYTAAGKKGVLAGVDTAGITYYDPQIAVDTNGNAAFYIADYATFIRVSPIINSTQLAWGAMGRAAGSGAYANSKYYSASPFMVMDPVNGTAVMSWQDGRNYNGYNGNNIMMRRFDKLLATNYYPPYKPVLTGGQNGSSTIQIDLTGSSKRYTLLEIFNNFTPSSPAAEMLDNNNIGLTRGLLFQNTGAIRTYNGKAYLNRNFNFKTEQNFNAQTKITLRLFFTNQDFDLLKAANSGINNPGDLVVVQQPTTTEFAPYTYVPAGQEKNFTVAAWKAVNGGYYVQAQVTRFTGINNYYIFPAGAFSLKQQASESAKSATITTDFIKKLYPTLINNNVLFIEVGNAGVKDMQVEVMTEDGKLLQRQRIPYQTGPLNLKTGTNGLYRIIITSGKYYYTGNIIKQRN